ncbi:hypothetical protein SLS57_011414 [Botryosphaeria dothidea]
MPQQPGEAPLCTLFADVHYYFSHPTAKPTHHRFDKGSYVYLYYNPNEHRGRVEIANYAGTPDQDAFTGYLDTVQVNRTHKQPNLFTITVDPSNAGSTPGSPQQDYSQWHLPAPDQRNEGKYMFKLHTLDLYMWTENDANTLVNSLQQILQPHQLRILDAPSHKSRHSEHSADSMSPVVKKLEQMAVTNPQQYRSTSVSTTQSFPGPPTMPATSIGEPPQAEPASYAPMAYNPAAPAAPEPISHREKTPPPPDAETGTGLAAAAVHEEGAQYGMQHHNSYQQHQPYMPGPPSSTPGSFPPPPTLGPTPAQIQRAQTTGSFPPPPPQQSANGTPPYGQSFAPPPPNPTTPGYGQTPTPTHPSFQRQSTMPAGYPGYNPSQQQQQQPPQPQYANYPQSPGYAPVQSPGLAPPGTPGHHHQTFSTPLQSPAYAPSPGMPPSGYSQYSYGQPTSQPQGQGEMYAVHGQLYRPTEQEASVHGHHKAPVQPGPGAPGPGKFEQRVDRVEKGVSKFLKRLDKKL